MWHRIAVFVIKFRVPLLIVLLAITAFMGWKATQVTLSYEFTSAVPTDNPKYITYQAFRKQFGEDGNTMVIGLQHNGFFEPSFFKDYQKLTVNLGKMPAVINVLSIPGAINLVQDTVNQNLKAIKIFSPDKIADDSTISSFNQIGFYNGLLYNAATKTYMMAIAINKQVLNSAGRTKVVDDIVAVADSFAQAHELEFHYSGLPLIRTKMANTVRSEMLLFIVLSFVLTGLILFLFFRSFVSVLSSMIVVAVGVIWSFGTIALLDYQITILTALIPPLIVVIGIPNCVYFLNKYHTEYHINRDKTTSLILMVDRMGIVTLFTNLTAAIGFGVFFFTKSQLLKEFGLVAGLNIMAIFFISLIFLPALYSFLPAPKGKHTNYLENKWLNKLLDALIRWVFTHRPWIWGTTILAIILSVIGMTRLQNVGHIVDDLPKSDKVYKDLKFFEKNFHGVMPLEIVIDTKRKNGAVSLPVLGKIDELSKYLMEYKEIGKPLSIAEGVKFANQAFNYGDSSYYIIPDQFGAMFLQPYLRGNINSDNSTLGKLTKSFVDSTKQIARISVSMADVGSIRLPRILDSIRPRAYEIFDTARYQVSFTGTSVVFLEGSRFIINSLRDSLILAFLMIFGCMVVLFRSWRIFIISFIVNLVPLMITAGIMGWAGIAIKPSTVLVFSVALGITIDVTIRFLVNFKQDLQRNNDTMEVTIERCIRETGLSIIYTSLILIAGFGVFALSHFDGTKSLGYLTSITLFLAMVTNLTLQPALLVWLTGIRKSKTVDWVEEESEVIDEAVKKD